MIKPEEAEIIDYCLSTLAQWAPGYEAMVVDSEAVRIDYRKGPETGHFEIVLSEPGISRTLVARYPLALVPARVERVLSGTGSVATLAQEVQDLNDQVQLKGEAIHSLRNRATAQLEVVERQAVAIARVLDLCRGKDMVRPAEIIAILEEVSAR